MGYEIAPVTIWANGQAVSGNYINSTICFDNLKDTAQFYWEIRSVGQDSNGIKYDEFLCQGNITISGADYDAWGQSADINFAAYEYICEQLNLTLIP